LHSCNFVFVIEILVRSKNLTSTLLKLKAVTKDVDSGCRILKLGWRFIEPENRCSTDVFVF